VCVRWTNKLFATFSLMRGINSGLRNGRNLLAVACLAAAATLWSRQLTLNLNLSFPLRWPGIPANVLPTRQASATSRLCHSHYNATQAMAGPLKVICATLCRRWPPTPISQTPAPAAGCKMTKMQEQHENEDKESSSGRELFPFYARQPFKM